MDVNTHTHTHTDTDTDTDTHRHRHTLTDCQHIGGLLLPKRGTLTREGLSNLV